MKEKKKIKYILLIIIILILVAINIQIFIKNNFPSEENDVKNENISSLKNMTLNVTSQEVDEQNRNDKIANLSEKLRVQTYFGQYISCIESRKYEQAYEMLYTGFKQTYFPTLQEFINYAEKTYPTTMLIEYEDIQREGTMFILKVKIIDVLNSNKQTENNAINVVIIENNVNDFFISFEKTE